MTKFKVSVKNEESFRLLKPLKSETYLVEVTENSELLLEQVDNCMIYDIAKGGLSFIYSGKIEIDKTIMFVVQYQNKLYVLPGTISWVKSENSYRYYGVHLTSNTQADQFINELLTINRTNPQIESSAQQE